MIDLRDDFPDVPWQQGSPLPVTDHCRRHWTRARHEEEAVREQLRLYARPDPLYSRILLWAFDTPEECQAVADKHNATLRRP